MFNFSSKRLFHGVSLLSSRRFLKLKGPDAGKFLQGVTTNDVNKLHAAGIGQYSALLNAQGRMMYDIFIYRLADESFYLECDGQIQERVLLHLQTYNLRTKASIEAVKDDSTVVFSSIPMEGSAAQLKDPRSNWNYSRYFFNSVADAQASIKALPSFSEGRYHRERILRGVPEGPFEIASRQAIPLEFNVDLMGGIDFAKGCYLGQELVARTHHRGVVRKRILPLRFFELDSTNLKPLRPASPFEFNADCRFTKNLDKQSEFLPTQIDAETRKLRITSRTDNIGKLVMSEANIGLGMMRLDALKSEESRHNLAVLDHVESRWLLADAIIPENWPASIFANL